MAKLKMLAMNIEDTMSSMAYEGIEVINTMCADQKGEIKDNILNTLTELAKKFDLTLEAEQEAAIAKAIADGAVGATEFKEVGNTVLQMTGADFEQDGQGNVTKYKGRALRPGVQDEINRVILKVKGKLARTPGGLQAFYKDTVFLNSIANEIKKIAETPAPQRKEGGQVIKDAEQYAIDRRNKLLNF